MSLLNKSLMFMLILTIVGSFLAYIIVQKAYSDFPDGSYYGE